MAEPLDNKVLWVTVAIFVALLGAAFLVPFVDASLRGGPVDLWPNPLFVVPLAALVVGAAALVLVLWDQGREVVRSPGRAWSRWRGRPGLAGDAGAARPLPPWPKDSNETYGGQDESTIVAGPDHWVVRCRLNDVGTGWRQLRCIVTDDLGHERFTDEIPRPARPEVPVVLEPHYFPEAQPPGRALTIRWEHAATRGYTNEFISERRLAVPPLLEPRTGWHAEHEPFGRDEILTLRSEGEALSGFRCFVIGPAGEHEADERTHVFVAKDALGFPEPRRGTSLFYPSGFPDGPKEGSLPSGDYEAHWWGWEYVDFGRYDDVYLGKTAFSRPRFTR